MTRFPWLRPKNLGTKLVALGLTLLVSGLVYLDQEHAVTIRVPLEVADLPAERVPLDDIPATASIQIVATGRRVAKIWLTGGRPEDVVLIARVPEGAEAFNGELTPVDVSLPADAGIRVTRIVEPQHLSFRLDVLTERELPVAPRVTGALPSGFVISGDVRVVPPVVTVSGPESLVRPLAEVHTRPVDLGERTRPFNASTELVLPERLSASPREVVVHADVEAERQDRLDGVRVVVRNTRGLAHTVDPTEGAVTLLGPESRVGRLRELASAGEPTGLVIAVDASGKGPGAYELTPVVELADDLRLVSVEPPRVQLILEEAPN